MGIGRSHIEYSIKKYVVGKDTMHINYDSVIPAIISQLFELAVAIVVVGRVTR